MIAQARVGIRARVVAAPAMFGARLVINLAAVVGVLCGLQKIVDQVNRVVEKIVIGLADIDMNFSFEFWSQRCPVAFQDVTKIVVLAPVFGYRMIYFSGLLVPDRFGIAVAAGRRIHCLPDIPLPA